MKNIYCIYDKKAETMEGYMLLEQDAHAVRGFAQACEKNEVFNKWPEDFSLWRLGTVLPNGTLIEKKEKLAEATSFVQAKEIKNNEKPCKINK